MKPRPCVVGSWDQGLYNIRKFRWPSLFSLFPIILFFICECCPGSCSNILKCLKFLSSVGSKIVGKGASILGGLAKILNKTMKG